MKSIYFSREWAMPSADTFSIKPIKKLITEKINSISKNNPLIIDPFVRNSPFKKLCFSNDIDTEIRADRNMDAIDFLCDIETETADMMLFDPPYSPRQVSECYKRLGKTVNMETTQSSFWSNLKKQVSRITKENGIVISFGWNSGGIGKKYGFELKQILLVPHGGSHNDTIVTVEEKKIQSQGRMF